MVKVSEHCVGTEWTIYKDLVNIVFEMSEQCVNNEWTIYKDLVAQKESIAGAGEELWYVAQLIHAPLGRLQRQEQRQT